MPKGKCAHEVTDIPNTPYATIHRSADARNVPLSCRPSPFPYNYLRLVSEVLQGSDSVRGARGR